MQIKTILLKATVEKDHVLKSLRVDRSLITVIWEVVGNWVLWEALLRSRCGSGRNMVEGDFAWSSDQGS